MVGLASAGLSANAQTLVTYATDTTATNPADGKSLAFIASFSTATAGTLVIHLKNLTTGTISRADLLTGIFFNLTGNTAQPANGVPAVGVALGTGSTVVQSNNTAASSQVVTGEFGFQDVSAKAGTSFEYMVNSTGFSNAGGTPDYSLPQPGASGDNYTLVPTPFQAGGIGPNNVVNVIKNEVILTLSGFTGLTSTSQLSNVGFAVGSGSQIVGGVSTYVIPLGHTTPEPDSLGLLIGLIASGGFYARRRRISR